MVKPNINVKKVEESRNIMLKDLDVLDYFVSNGMLYQVKKIAYEEDKILIMRKNVNTGKISKTYGYVMVSIPKEINIEWR